MAKFDGTERPSNMKAGEIVPSHGNGRLVPFKKGHSGNPGGRGSAYHETRKMLKDATPEAARRAIELLQSPDERVAMVAIQFVFERAFGKAGPEKPDADGHRAGFDYSKLSGREMTTLAGIFAKIGAMRSDQEDEP
jgi:hypothetical protein